MSMTALGAPPGTTLTVIAADGENALQSLDSAPTVPAQGSYSAKPTNV